MKPTRGLFMLASLLLAAAAPAMAATRAQGDALFGAVALHDGAATRAAANSKEQQPAQTDTAQAESSAHPSVPAPASPVSEQPPYVQLLAGLGVVLWLGLRSTASQ
jgi:hypothetical protein